MDPDKLLALYLAITLETNGVVPADLAFLSDTSALVPPVLPNDHWDDYNDVTLRDFIGKP